MARAIKLINAPVGLFDIDGVLVLKTEYSTQHEDGAITPDCYIVDSGEYFWGGVDSVEERNNLMVTPIDMPTIAPPNEWVSVEDRLPNESDDYLVCTEDTEMFICWYFKDTKQWDKEDYPFIYGGITHWMPLPALPKYRTTEGEEDA